MRLTLKSEYAFLANPGTFFVSKDIRLRKLAVGVGKIMRDHRHTLRKAQLLFHYILKTQF